MNRRPDKPRRDGKRRQPTPPATRAAVSDEVHRGVEFLQRGDLSAAQQCFERARLANPADPIAVNCLGIIARKLRRLNEAMQHFQRAIELRPDFAEAHNNLGNAARDANDLAQAERCYRRAIELKPDFAEPHNNLGVVQLTLGRVDEAVRCFEGAIERQPTYAEAHNNLANAFRLRGELLDAVACLSTALQFKPAASEIHLNLGHVLHDLGRPEEACQAYEHAIQLQPQSAEAYVNLANAWFTLENWENAMHAYAQAVRLEPQSADHHVRLGNARQLMGDTDQARVILQHAVELAPQCLEHRLRLSAVCPPVFDSNDAASSLAARAKDEWTELAHEAQRCGGWTFSGRLAEPSFNWQFLAGNPRPLRECYANIFRNSFRSQRLAPRTGRPRLGIVVTGGHEGLFLRSLAGVIDRLDLSEYDLSIVAPRASEGKLKGGLQREALAFVPISSDLRQAAEAIRTGHFDVLYYWEIGTDTINYFLPFLRLAPIQCTSWGIQVTSGIPQVDYYLSNRWVEPDDAQQHYSERLLCASTFLTWQIRPELAQPIKPREAFGLRATDHLYLCAQQPGKFHPDFDAWLAGILRSDPQGVVVSAGDRFGFATRRLQQRLQRTIPDVASRCVFLPRLAYHEYLQLLSHADVLLDPPHFGGVNSTYDALALGQPIVTLPSQFHRGRYTAGCLRKIGAEDCVVDSVDAYVRLAVELATQPDRRESLRRSLLTASGELYYDQQAVVEHDRLFAQLISESRERSDGQAGPSRTE